MKYLITTLAIMLCNSTEAQYNLQLKSTKKMQVAVWDTYVTKKDGKIMHFDIIAPSDIKDAAIIHSYGKAYLKSKGQEGQSLSAKECRFCHVRMISPQWEEDIRIKGYYILEMENCE